MNTDRKALLAILFTGLAASATLGLVSALLPGRELAKPVPDPRSFRIRPSVRPFGPGEQLTYALGWNGVPCGSVRMGLKEEVKEGRKWLVLNYEVRNAEAIAWAWSYWTRGETYLDPETLLPDTSSRTSIRNEKTKLFVTMFDRSTGVAETVIHKLYKNTRSVKRISFRHGLDLPAAFLLARTLELRTGRSVVMEVLHEDESYAVELTPGEKERVEVPAGSFEAVPLELRARLLAGGEEEDEAQPSFPSMRIWITSRDRLPVKLEAEASVGHVYAELVSVQQ